MLEPTFCSNCWTKQATRHCIVIPCRFTKTLRNTIFCRFFLVLFLISFHFIPECLPTVIYFLIVAIRFDRSNQILEKSPKSKILSPASLIRLYRKYRQRRKEQAQVDVKWRPFLSWNFRASNSRTFGVIYERNSWWNSSHRAEHRLRVDYFTFTSVVSRFSLPLPSYFILFPLPRRFSRRESLNNGYKIFEDRRGRPVISVGWNGRYAAD